MYQTMYILTYVLRSRFSISKKWYFSWQQGKSSEKETSRNWKYENKVWNVSKKPKLLWVLPMSFIGAQTLPMSFIVAQILDRRAITWEMRWIWLWYKSPGGLCRAQQYLKPGEGYFHKKQVFGILLNWQININGNGKGKVLFVWKTCWLYSTKKL